MKALLMKDCFVIWKQLKLFLVIILVITVLNGSFGNVFIVVLASMLPYTAMAYDEQSKWDQLAAMMPYSVQDIVLSKYVLGWLYTAAAGLFTQLVQLVLTLLGSPLAAFEPASVLSGFCASLCLLSIILPPMFRMGTEKGRLWTFLVVFLVCGTAGALSDIIVDGPVRGAPFLLAVLAIAAVVLTAVSIPLSIRLYTRRLYARRSA